MRYHDGTEVRLCDVVTMAGKTGQVVCMFDDGLFAGDFAKSDWEFLESGVLIDFAGFGPIHYDHVPEADISFIMRRSD